MAVTGFWPIYKNLKATLDYADNPDKTTDRRYLDDDLYAALSYAENDNKTDRKMYVGGINCSKQNAYAEMIAVQRRFGLRGKVVGYHGIQSFREGEVTPEQAFEIGMRLIGFVCSPWSTNLRTELKSFRWRMKCESLNFLSTTAMMRQLF